MFRLHIYVLYGLWWWVTHGGPHKQNIIILHLNLFMWLQGCHSYHLRKYARKFGSHGSDLELNSSCQVDQRSSKASSQEKLICIQPVSPHLPTQANLSGEKGPETQKHMVILVFTCTCTCICICHHMVQVVLVLVLYFYCSCNCTWSYPLIPDL